MSKEKTWLFRIARIFLLVMIFTQGFVAALHCSALRYGMPPNYGQWHSVGIATTFAIIFGYIVLKLK